MGPVDRSLSDVFQDIIRNVQEIVRSEVRLAKTEILEEVAKAKSGTLMLGAGIIAALFATALLLLMVVYALTLVVPSWAAALIVGGLLAVVASVMIAAGMRQLNAVRPTPVRTVETIKENVEWAKQQTK